MTYGKLRLEDSRYFISKENQNEAIERVFAPDPPILQKTTSFVAESKDIFSSKSPFKDVESLLERLGFKTRLDYNSNIWISDFEDREVTHYEFTAIMHALVSLSEDEDGAFIYFGLTRNDNEGAEHKISIESGRSDYFTDERTYTFDANGRSPFKR